MPVKEPRLALGRNSKEPTPAALNGGTSANQWHRLYLEAVIPANGEIHVI
jgi:hypothetical protein